MRVWSLVFCTAMAVSSGTSSAAVLSFQGIFNNDSQTEIFSFIAGSTGVTIQTVSYAGGFNAAGKLIARGGFDPLLSLYGPGPGNVITPLTPLIGTNDDGAGAAVDPFTGAALDSILPTTAALISLIPGRTYFVVLSQSGNFPNSNLYRDGFSGVDTSLFGCTNGHFCDVTADNRDGHWALDIFGAITGSNTSFPLPLAPGPFVPPVITSFESFSSTSGDPDTGDNSGPSGPLTSAVISDPGSPTPAAPGCLAPAPCGGDSNNGNSDSGNPGGGAPASTAVDVNALPNPEPSSALLLGTALAGVFWFRRRLLAQGSQR